MRFLARTFATACAAAALAGGAVADTDTIATLELPAAHAGDTLAVFYSGDGGWAAIDKQVSAKLVAGGVPVVGVSSLRYFWTQRTAEGAAADLAAAIERYSRAWKTSKVILVGYSFGADPLPLMAQHLPPEARKKVRLIAMLSPDARAELRFRPVDWVGFTSSDATPVADALKAIPDVPVLCFYGDHEKAPACLAFAGLVRSQRMPGDHHFNGRYDAVGQAILDALAHPGA